MTGRQVVLTGTDGSTWDLGVGDLRLSQSDPVLWGMPPVAVTERVAWALPGSTVTGRRHAARDVVLPLVVIPDDPYDLEGVLARFAQAVDPAAGDVTVTVTRGDGTAARRIVATYLAGLDGLSLSAAYTGYVETAIALRAGDPYWQSTGDETVTVTPPPPVFTSGTSPFDQAADIDGDEPFDGYFIGVLFDDGSLTFDAASPFDGAGGGTVLFNVTNVGDVTAYPTFTVHGPATWVEATNLSTGEYWQLPTRLAPTSVLAVTSKPGGRSFRVDDTNTYGQLTAGSALWGLPPGGSLIAVRFDGTAAGSTFTVDWTPRYLTC